MPEHCENKILKNGKLKNNIGTNQTTAVKQVIGFYSSQSKL